jgi:hypothetical protein
MVIDRCSLRAARATVGALLCSLLFYGCGGGGGSAPQDTLSIKTQALPDGEVTSAYSFTLAATGGTAPYAWVLAKGNLPTGLTLDSETGAITGKPQLPASNASLTFEVTDSGSTPQHATVSLVLNVMAQLSVTTQTLLSAVVGESYSETLAESGGHAPYTWSVASGLLPAGLSLNAKTGVISGTPITAGAAAVTFGISDSNSPPVTSSVTLTVSVETTLGIEVQPLPTGIDGNAYNATLSATGGTGPYTWTLQSGTLPAGLSLNTTTGVISGTPAGPAGSTSLTLDVSDSSNPAQSATVNVTVSVAAPLKIVTAALPGGQIGQSYSAVLAGTGGTGPFSWTLTGGALPTGLTLNSSSGQISGTPTAAAAQLPLIFTVSDSGVPTQSQSVALVLNVSPATITLTLSPRQAGITVNQPLTLTATTNDNAGVAWSVAPTGGSFSAAASLSGVGITYTPPSSPGVYTITATSVTSPSQQASSSVGVTNLAGVYTYHNDLARDGANTQEYALTTANVNSSTFGKLFSCPVDGGIYTQPLWVAGVVINGAAHNVIFVGTAHDSLYAFDADANPCSLLWQVSLIDVSHGALAAGESSIPGDTNFNPELGITGTPVIDPASNILYVVSDSQDAAGANIYQRLHAIDLTSGKEESGSPLTVNPTYPGTYLGTSTITFDPAFQTQRTGLVLANGTVYVAWGSHEDFSTWFGWIVGYRYTAEGLSQTSVLNVTPNVGEGGIWMAGSAPAVDDNGSLYLLTGNGKLDAANAPTIGTDYGDSALQLNGNLSITSWFSPSTEAGDALDDYDFGSGGAVVLNIPGAPVPHIVFCGGKEGYLYVLNGDDLGGWSSTDATVLERIQLDNGIFSTPAFWNNLLYASAHNNPVGAYTFNPSTESLSTSGVSYTATSFGFPGTTPSVSADGNVNGIVWALDQTTFCNSAANCGPVILHAYDANNLATELWNSSLTSTDAAGFAVVFTVPTIANGKVYVGTRGNNAGGIDSSSSVPGELDVYGLEP